MGRPEPAGAVSASPVRDTGPSRRRRAVVLLLVGVMVVASFSTGVALWDATHPPPSRHAPPAQLTPLVVTVNSHKNKQCAHVATCATTATSFSVHSNVWVFVGFSNTTSPTAISVTGCPQLTWTTQKTLTSSTTNGQRVWNATEATAQSCAVVVNFTSALTNYVIVVVDVSKSTLVSLDVLSAGSTGTTGSTASDSQTTTVNNDLVLEGVSIGKNAGLTAGGSATQVDTGNVGTGPGVAEGVDDQTVATAGATTMTETWTGNAIWTAVTVSLKPAAVPAAPTGLTVGTLTTTTVPLTWTQPAGAALDVNDTVYQATYASGACGAYSTKYSVGSATTSFTVTGLTSGGDYCFEVTEWNTTGESAASAAVTNVVTLHVPPAPTGLVASPQPGTTNQIQLQWVNPTGTNVNATVYQGTAACASLTGQDAGGPTTTSYLWTTGLSALTTYGFEVRVWNATGQGTATSCVTATTYGAPGGPPTGVQATAETTTSISLSWSQPTGTLVNDTVRYGTPSGATCSSTTTVSTGGVASAFTVTALAPFTTYCFQVSAWTNGAQSAWSTPIFNATTLAGTPGAPTNLVQTGATITTVTVGWTGATPSSGSIQNYTVFYGTSCSALSSSATNGNAVPSITITALAAGTTYCWRVSEWTQGGQSARSAFSNFTTDNALPGAVTSLHFVSAGSTNLTFAWTQATGVIVNDTFELGASCAALTEHSTGVATTWTQNGLVHATTYCVAVFAWSNGGFGPEVWSNGSTQGATPPAPLYLNLSSHGNTFLSVTWVNPSGYTLINDTVYVHATTCGPPWTLHISTLGVAASYNITGLVASTTYCIEVTAWDAQSPPSAPLIAQTSGNPGGGGFVGPNPFDPLWLVFAVILFFLVVLLVIALGSRRRR